MPLDQRLSGTEPSQRREVRIREPVGDVGRASEQSVRAVNVVRVEHYEAVHDHEVSPGRTVELTVVEQSLDPSDPTSASGTVASEQQMERKPETTSGGPFGHVQS